MTATSNTQDRRPKPSSDSGSETASSDSRGGGRSSRIRKRIGEFPARSRRVISEHRQKRKRRDREVSDQSRRGLDWTNFFLADVQMGFGSFLAYYLANFGWSKQDVGLALTAGGLASMAAQIPGGALADAVHWKRGLAALGIMAIAVSALILALRPSYPLVFVAEVLHGISGGILGPVIAAISLGLAGRRGMSSRVGRNLRFAAAGNALTAAVLGALGTYVSVSAIFIGSAILCIPTLFALLQIRADEIDYVRARNAAKHDHALDLQRLVDFAKNWNLLLFTACMVLFHFSNASLLPLVGENLAYSRIAHGPAFMAGLIVVPQIVVAILAPWIGYWSELWGRKPLLLIGFAVEASRALLFSLVADPGLMIVVQVLDGITGAVVTVLTILVITDLTTGTGRFNLAQGVIGTFTGIAAAISPSAMGFIVLHFGDSTGFLTMAVFMLLGMSILWLLLPETKPVEYLD
jgi:MFS family permease